MAEEQALKYQKTKPLLDIADFKKSPLKINNGTAISSIEKTLAIIKPEATHHIFEIKLILQQFNFIILHMCFLKLSQKQAEDFYKQQKNEKHFSKLVKYMSEEYVYVMVLWRTNAVDAWNSLLGPTDPVQATKQNPGFLRARFGLDQMKNAFHGSEDALAAKKEISYFFNEEMPLKVEKTLAIIKPDLDGCEGELEKIIKEEGFDIVQKHKLQLDQNQAAQFYSNKKDDPNYNDLIKFMISGPVQVIILERPGAVEAWKSFMKEKDIFLSKEPCPEYLRSFFQTERIPSMIHASESEIQAEKEISFFFPEGELYEKTLLIVKPDAMRYAKEIEDILLKYKFVLVDKKTTIVERKDARKIYKTHHDQPYYRAMVTHLCSGPVNIMLLEKLAAIESLKQLAGPWDVKEAKKKFPESIRAIYGTRSYLNAVDVSQELEAAAKDILLFFPAELIDYVEIPIPVEKTLALILPHAIKKADAIHHMILEEGLSIINQRKFKLSAIEAELFYSNLDSPNEFSPMVEVLCSGCVIAMVLGGLEVIDRWKELMGPIYPIIARETYPRSIRALFGKSKYKKAVHGSETMNDAEREIKFFFPNMYLESHINSSQVEFFISSQFQSVLLSGLGDVTKSSPQVPILALAEYLSKHNPNVPSIGTKPLDPSSSIFLN